MEYKGKENTRQKARDFEQVDKHGNVIKNNHEFVNEHPVLFPFGPPVYLDKVPDNILRELDVLIETLGAVSYTHLTLPTKRIV